MLLKIQADMEKAHNAYSTFALFYYIRRSLLRACTAILLVKYFPA